MIYLSKLLQKTCIIILAVVSLFTVSAFSQVKIALSKPSSNYEKWLISADPSVIPMGMYSLKIDSAVQLLTKCSALLLTGGEDVDPVNYGKSNEIHKCEDIDRYRDSLEFALIRKALSMKMPIFGICRGEQILNVALGGTLITDIPTDTDNSVIHRCPPESKECLHPAVILKKTTISKITRQTEGMVNSYHHQAVEKPAPGLRITARSSNGVTEAVESDNTIVKSFLLGVQWHPERLSQNPALSKPLAEKFVREAKKFSRKVK